MLDNPKMGTYSQPITKTKPTVQEKVYNDDNEKIEELMAAIRQLEKKVERIQRKSNEDKGTLVKMMNTRFQRSLNPYLLEIWSVRYKLEQAMKPRGSHESLLQRRISR